MQEMVKRESIEALAVHFTAGVAAGTLLSRIPVSAYSLSGGLFLILASLLLAVLRTRRMGILFPAFLLCGAFCALTDAFAGPGPVLTRWASAPAEKLRGFIDTVPFPSEGTAPLLKAFLTGDRSGLSGETVRIFRGSGASHLLALSGLHMGILYLLLSRILWPLGNSPAVKRFRYGVTLLSAGLFTLMTGATPSIVRAFLFIALRETALLLGRPHPPLRVLSTALLIQLVISPSVLRSTGFQLSYLAMAGIFLLYPRLDAWYPRSHRFDPVRRIWQTAALSISCQVFTGPLAWIRFHTFPKYFLLTNLLAMPLTTLLMGTAVMTLALLALGCCPALLVQATDALCRTLIFILSTISTL